MQTLLADLRAIVGSLHVLSAAPGEREALAIYERDWRKRYHGDCLAVVLPANVPEVAAVVARCAREEGLSIVAQGGNTGLVGGGVPDDSRRQIVLSLKRLRQVRLVDAGNQTITVEAGLVLQEVQQAAAGAGLLFPLSLAAEGSCTIGGNLATNAGGTQVLRFGNARELCLGLEVVTASGEIWRSLDGLRKDNTGYDLRDLFVGSEGTLGIITAATLRLFPQPRARITGWAACATLADAVALMRRLRDAFDAELVGFEAMNDASLALVAHHFPELRQPLPAVAGDPGAPWCALFDLASPHEEATLRADAEVALTAAANAGELMDAVLAQSEAQAGTLWRLREAIPLAQAAEGLNIKHDIAVPLSSIAAFVSTADAALAASVPGARHITFGHLGDGNLHYNLQAPAGSSSAEFLLAYEHAANTRVYDVAAQFGGTFSAEHGIGRLKRDELGLRKSPVALALMRAIKSALDPRGLFNPGVLLPTGIAQHADRQADGNARSAVPVRGKNDRAASSRLFLHGDERNPSALRPKGRRGAGRLPQDEESELSPALLAAQACIVVFLALHDWIPLGRLNNLAAVRKSDSRRRLFLVTLLSTAPFALGLVGSLMHPGDRVPHWLLIYLRVSYLAMAYGAVRAWWIPYLFGATPARRARNQLRFAGTHAFLPERHGIRPDTLHVAFHAVLLLTTGLLVLAPT